MIVQVGYTGGEREGKNCAIRNVVEQWIEGQKQMMESLNRLGIVGANLDEIDVASLGIDLVVWQIVFVDRLSKGESGLHKQTEYVV